MILIDIAMPDKCGNCPCFHAEYPMYCQAVKASRDKRIEAPYGLPRPEWCPLQAQPCEDAVSREAVLKAIDFAKTATWSQSVEIRCNKLYSEIKDLPSVRPAPVARVMTLEEVQDAHDEEVPVWLESCGTWHGRKGFWIFVYWVNIEKETMFYNATHMCTYGCLGIRSYNKIWRCWTAKPTDAQREATPWE